MSDKKRKKLEKKLAEQRAKVIKTESKLGKMSGKESNKLYGQDPTREGVALGG